MKKLIIVLGIMLCFGMVSFAQRGEDDHNREEARKRIEASKVAYITSYLDLSSEESAKFWPVYNEYHAAIKKLRDDRGERSDVAELTDAQAKDKLNKYIEYSAGRAEITDKYFTEFRKIISDKKVLMLLKAEGEFKKQMVKRYADKKRENRGGKGDRR